MLPFLMSCAEKIPVEAPDNTRILLSPCIMVWSRITPEQGEQPLKDFKNCDILTSTTMREVKDHNDEVRRGQ